jgi:hypothetical protein
VTYHLVDLFARRNAELCSDRQIRRRTHRVVVIRAPRIVVEFLAYSIVVYDGHLTPSTRRDLLLLESFTRNTKTFGPVISLIKPNIKQILHV